MDDKLIDNNPSSDQRSSAQARGEQDGGLSRSTALAVDGQGFKRLIEASLSWLRHHQAAINSLNVFPVPDGDTGTNMLLTMQSAWDEIADSPEQNVGAVAHAVAHGALMGARGNSGVILSQLWRGFARSLGNKQTFVAVDLAQAFQEASDTAYRGVIKPVEGTILTVARETANAADQVTQQHGDLVTALDYIVGQTKQAVARTPSQLAVLADAGVVDAGGQGFYVILEAMLRYLRGDSISKNGALEMAVDLKTIPSIGHAEPESAPTRLRLSQRLSTWSMDMTCSSSLWGRNWTSILSAKRLMLWGTRRWSLGIWIGSRSTSTFQTLACLSATVQSGVPSAMW